MSAVTEKLMELWREDQKNIKWVPHKDCTCVPKDGLWPMDCQHCTAERLAWNRKAAFNNEVLNPLRDIWKAEPIKRIFKYYFGGHHD